MEILRDIHKREKVFERCYERVQDSSMSDREKKKIRQFILDLRIGKAGKKVKFRRLTSYLQYLLKLHEYFKNDIDRISEKHATQFYIALQDNKILKQNGMPYSGATKEEFTKTIKRYLGWAWGKNSSKYQSSIAWMKGSSEKIKKNAIILNEAQRILGKEKSLMNRCLFIFLFDSGARIEEALNVRIKDFVLSRDGKFYMVHLRGTKNEEADRTISIPIATRTVNEWIKEHPTGDPETFIFPFGYANARKIIGAMSLRDLGFKLKPHELRHSSATHYVQIFGASNIAGFYHRYGWKFGSSEADTYIKSHLFGGEVGQQKVVRAIESNRVEELECEIRELKDKIDFSEPGRGNGFVQGQGFMVLLTNLILQQKEMAATLEELTGRKFNLVLQVPGELVE